MRTIAISIIKTLALIAAVFVAVGIVLAACGYPPVVSLIALIEGSLVGWPNLVRTFLRACPLLLTGLAVALAFRCGAFNIGAEGQYVLGALGLTWVATRLQGSEPSWFFGQGIVLPLALLAAMLIGALWGAIPGLLKVRSGVPEVISTIMMNFIAIYFVSYAVHGPLREASGNYPQSDPLADTVMLLNLDPRTRFHAGVFLALIAALLIYVLVFRTTWGFRMRATGFNPQAALHAGMRPGRMFVLAMALSGALAGLAGAIQVAGVDRRLFETVGVGYGYTAIAVALIARLHPLGVIPAALFFGALMSGAEKMQWTTGVPRATVDIVQGLIILLAVVTGIVSLSFAGKSSRQETGAAAPGEAKT